MILQDRVVLITGAGQGIGRGIATAVGEEGGRVIATDLDESSAGRTAELIVEGGGQAVAVVADVTDSRAIAHAIERAVETFGRLDGLVNNAGVLRMAPALETAADDWQHQFQINVQAVGECCGLVAKQMIAQGEGGSIVNVASNAGKIGYPNMAVYNATKAAVISLTRSLSAEWAGNKINVNAVCPGGVDTPMLEEVAEWVGPRIGADPEALRSTMTPAQLGRHIQPIEVGRVVAFLLSDRAVIIRGQSVNVDGGDTPY